MSALVHHRWRLSGQTWSGCGETSFQTPTPSVCPGGVRSRVPFVSAPVSGAAWQRNRELISLQIYEPYSKKWTLVW